MSTQTVTITVEETKFAEDDCSATACIARNIARARAIANNPMLYDADCEYDIITDAMHLMAEKYGEEQANVYLAWAIRNYEGERRDLLIETKEK